APPSLTLRPPPSPTLFPYTTLFRSDVRGGSVRIGVRRRRAARVGVAEDDLPVRLDPGQRQLVGDPAALTVRDRHADDLAAQARRSEEHTSELQSPDHLVCRLLLEKK